MMARYMETGLIIHDHKSPKTAKLTLDALVDETLSAAGLTGGGGPEPASSAARQQVPILHIWDLNTGGGTSE